MSGSAQSRSEKPAEPSGRPGKEDAHYKFLGVNAMANFERYQVESSLSFTCRFRPRLGVSREGGYALGGSESKHTSNILVLTRLVNQAGEPLSGR
jgi:hypothetical protein